MYSTCLFCHSALGRNESFEEFPIGRRIAYDASKGRLWVVCAKCARWNLSPIEERWEAIESAERVYRDTKKRVATDNIGLARLRDGTDLIRIGAPLRPEFAAWRYGANFSKRHKKGLLCGGAAVAVVGGIVGGAITASSGTIISAALTSFTYLHNAHGIWQFVGRKMNRVTVTANDGLRIRIARPDLPSVTVLGGSAEYGEWSAPKITFYRRGKERERGVVKNGRNPDGTLWTYGQKMEIIDGPEALVSLARILAATNSLSGAPRHVASAVSMLEHSNSLPHLLGTVSQRAKAPALWAGPTDYSKAFPLGYLPVPARLALEMSLHEEDERRAMEGDLLDLENRWKEAEEIAGIADSLTVPESTISTLTEYKAKSPRIAPDSPSKSD